MSDQSLATLSYTFDPPDVELDDFVVVLRGLRADAKHATAQLSVSWDSEWHKSLKDLPIVEQRVRIERQHVTLPECEEKVLTVSLTVTSATSKTTRHTCQYNIVAPNTEERSKKDASKDRPLEEQPEPKRIRLSKRSLMLPLRSLKTTPHALTQAAAQSSFTFAPQGPFTFNPFIPPPPLSTPAAPAISTAPAYEGATSCACSKPMSSLNEVCTDCLRKRGDKEYAIALGKLLAACEEQMKEINREKMARMLARAKAEQQKIDQAREEQERQQKQLDEAFAMVEAAKEVVSGARRELDGAPPAAEDAKEGE
jgi:hypothetical protein